MTVRLVRELVVAGSVLVLSTVLSLAPASALPRYGPLEVSGNISAQQLIRHPDADVYSLVQQRNTFKLRVDYATISQGRFLDRYNIGFIDRAKVFILYRGVYDSVYGYTPSFSQNDIWGRPIGLNLSDVGGRKRIQFENSLREAYTDISLRDLPLSFRIGRQQIVWGETDNFRLLDRINALNFKWHLQQESWDELREPSWMIKGLWDIDRIGPLSGSFVEFYWNPGDWNPAQKVFLPQPWSAPIVDPLNDPRTPPPSGRGLYNIINSTFRCGSSKACPYPVKSLYKNTTLFQQGAYTRNPWDNSQAGVRFSAVTPQGVQFTLNYFYERWNNDDGTNAAAYQGIIDLAQARQALLVGQAPLEAISPYIHTVGVSANYADEDYTQAVFRMESIYEMGVPFTDASKHYNPNGPFGSLAKDVFGVSKSNTWKGMLGFDRPTWIRPLNRKATFLVLGQFFWHYLQTDPPISCNDPTEGIPCSRSGQGGGFRGQFSTSGIASSGYVGRDAFIDRVRRWEMLTTLATTTFYSGGKFVPFVVYVLDPMNSFNMEVIWMADYFITNNVILNLSQRYFVNTTSTPVFESWGVGGINRGRSETGIRLTYQF
jgi:hypothetical protein